MKKQLLIFLITLITYSSYSQVNFEKGYFIDSANQRVDCLIKNVDWRNNPSGFEYKLNATSEQKKISITEVKAFGIINSSKYVRSDVDIDRSSNSLEYLNTSRNPIFKQEQLFLKVLIEGSATLYLYEDGNLQRFFYNTPSTAIKQLIHKSYKTIDEKVGENNEFKQQLLNELTCEQITVKDVESIRYSKRELVRFFEKYNLCSNADYTTFETKNKQDLFNLYLRAGINSSSLQINNPLYNYGLPHQRVADFGTQIGFRGGVELEFIMAFNKNKWALIIEPTYQYFKTEKALEIQNSIVNYTSIEVPIGLRHYMFLNEKSKLFINGSIIFEMSSDFSIEYDISPDLIGDSKPNLAFGFGYNHNNQYNIELRYLTNRNVLGNYVGWHSKYTVASVIFGYSLF